VTALQLEVVTPEASELDQGPSRCHGLPGTSGPSPLPSPSRSPSPLRSPRRWHTGRCGPGLGPLSGGRPGEHEAREEDRITASVASGMSADLHRPSPHDATRGPKAVTAKRMLTCGNPTWSHEATRAVTACQAGGRGFISRQVRQGGAKSTGFSRGRRASGTMVEPAAAGLVE